jgi:CHAT domain-containing protein
LENTVAYKNAKQFKNLLESTYKPTIYKETGFINKNTKNGIEIAYNIPFKLIKDQELRNNTTEGKEFKALEKLEEQQQEAVNKIVYENLEDYINDEGDAGFVITKVFQDGTVQISKLTRIQDLDELRKKLYKKAEQNYKYSVDLSIEAQERITEQLTGMLMDSVSDDLLNKKQPKIFYKEKVCY